MDEYITCCAVCGNTYLGIYPKITICSDCHDIRESFLQKRTTTYTSKYPKRYYEEKATNLYGDSQYWKKVFVEEELSKNPLFDYKKYQISYREDIEREKRKQQIQSSYNQSQSTLQPKCPTCGSTNIQRISDLNRGIHALAFGLLSNTVRSQFCCNNCGYKW